MARPRTAGARDRTEVPGETSALGFRLSLDDGRAVLDLPEGCTAGVVRVEKLRLEIPEVRYPFDLSAGLTRFQSRRCLLRELQVAVPASALGAWLAAAPLARYGLHHPWVSASAAGMRLVLRAELGGRSALVTGRLTLQPRPGGSLRLSIQAARAYGFLPVPVPLVMAALLTALGAPPTGGLPRPPSPGAASGERWWVRPPALLATTGPTDLDLSALDLVLFPLMAERGWRLPERRAMALATVDIDGDELRLGFLSEGEGAGRPPLALAPPLAEAGDLFALGEEALAAGELRAAREAYRHAAAAAPGGTAGERLLALLLASADSLPAAAEAAAAQLGRRPDEPAARLAQAVVAAEGQRFEEAASLYQRAAARWEADGELLEAACARHAASEALERAGRSSDSQAELVRALAAWGEEPAPLRVLWKERLAGQEAVVAPAVPESLVRARAAWREGDLSAAARQYEAVLVERDAGEGAAEAHLRLAQWARLNGQMMVASRHLGQAMKLEAEAARAAPLEVLVEVLDASGRADELEAALGLRRERAGAGSAAAGAVARALGQVLERAGRAPAAVNVYQQWLVEEPADTYILGRLAEIHRRESQHQELASALERLFALGLADPGRGDIDLEAVGLELAQVHDEVLAARDQAAAVLERLCAACPSSSEAREALAALDRRPAGAED